MTTYLSLGAGVDTTAIILMPDVMDKTDFVIFADTGSENPETYTYLNEIIKPYLEKLHKPLVIVHGEETVQGEVITNMEEAYLKWNAIPVRFMRHCTDKWKIRPMQRYLKEHYPEGHLTKIIGFAYDEIRRVKCQSDETWYPLIEKKMTRADCIQYIQSRGFPVPPKSGCFYCPFQRLDQWKELRVNHPDLWQRAIELEKNGSHYPEMTLSNFRKKGKPLTLEEVDKKLGTSLYNFEEEVIEECSGSCMT